MMEVSGPIAVIGHGTVRGDAHAEALALLGEVVAISEKESGTLVFAVHVDTEKPNDVWVYEVFADQKALDEHRRNIADVRPRLYDVLQEPMTLRWCKPTARTGF